MKLLQVRNWNEHFENNRTRELVQMRWVPFQNSFDGDGFIELLEDHEDGLSHFACWVLLVEVASTCNPRGTLIRSNGKSHDARTLSRKTRGDCSAFEKAIPRLLSIGWLEEIDASEAPPQDTAGKSHPTTHRRKEGNGKEGNGKKIVSRFVPPLLVEVKAYCEARKNKIDPQAFIDFYESVGWLIGGKAKMKDWRSAIRNWERREKVQGVFSAKANQTRPPLEEL